MPNLYLEIKVSTPSQHLSGFPIYRFDHEIAGDKLIVRALVVSEDLQFNEINLPTGCNLYKVPPGTYRLVDGFDSRTIGTIETSLGTGSMDPNK